ncbi:cysteine--tRNA ligase [Candidatus Poribacteria bacterium]|nr:cysteine--tRNA ligase [Candidatus Poribacteria bacterium]
MGLRVYNTLSRKKEDFVPLDPAGRKVLFYNCGPTVYGPFHIGNARNFVVVDVMRRWIEHLGYELRFVQNITDVDDKIIARAIEEGIPANDVAAKYTALFFEHIGRLGIRRADEHPRATQYVEAMIHAIEDLAAKGHAYASEDGSVWFDVKSFPGYGKLSRKNLEEMREGERVSSEQQRLKRNPLDFSLWKAAKPGEPAWKSPWGEGRPGWHIECSVMSKHCLGSETIDIHAGGIDLQFPHHENEIAQSECATGKPFARYWIHNGFLNISGEKMSKSLGNIKNLDGLLERYDALTLRHFLVSAHYRTELDFTESNLDAAAKASSRYASAWREAVRILAAEPTADAWRADAECQALMQRFADAMNDDFNTAQALAVLFDLVTALNTDAAAAERSPAGPRAALEARVSLLCLFRTLLGLTPELEAKSGGLDGITGDLLQLLIDLRAEARKAKQFALADMVRARLAALGIALEDKPGGTVWKRANP